MKKLFTFFCFFALISPLLAQQASDYFPSSTGFEWKYKVTPLDSASNPVTFLAEFRIDSFALVANYKGQLSNIVETKKGQLQTIQQQPFLDSLFYYTNGTDGFEYLSTKNIEEFLISLDQQGVISNFSFVSFFASLQNWYSTFRLASDENLEYNILQKDTSVSVGIFSVPVQFTYIGKRLADQTLQTVLNSYDCKKFLLQWKIASSALGGDLITLSDTIWLAPGNWIVQDIMPGQYVNNSTLTLLGINPFSIPGLETKLTNEIAVAVENEKSTPTTFSLNQNYPNPFNPSTKISWQLPVSSNVTLKIYNVLGNEVDLLVNEYQSAGNYDFTWNAKNLPSGIYFCRLQAGSFVQTRKMILIK